MNNIKAFFTHAQHRDRAAYLVMLIFSITALIAAFTLTIEKLEKLANPQVALSCTINLVLDCGRVMDTWQSHVFGFPNMLIGMMAYPVLITVAVAGLGGVRFPRWFMRTAAICIAAGALFAYWLFFSSVYVIGILCPWCLIVTFSTTLILAAFTHIGLLNNIWGLKKARDARVQKFLASGYDKVAVFGWIVLLVALVFIRFGTQLFA